MNRTTFQHKWHPKAAHRSILDLRGGRRALRMCLAGGLLLCLAAEADDDAVPFKPRDYKPSKTLRTNAYKPKTYAPKPHTPAKQQTHADPADFKAFNDKKALSDKAMDPGTAFKGKVMDKPSAANEKAYQPNDPLFPSTITADKAGATYDKKPFLLHTNDSPFIATERPKERNPLLEPRQGIKAPEETPPKKDFTP